MATTRRFEFFTGIKDEVPILPGVFPFGMIYGVLALGAHIPAITAQAMSSVVFAGSSQFIIAQLVAAGTPPIVIIVTAFIVNIRHMLYSASLAPFVKRLPTRWKWLLAYLLTDEAYAVTISHYRYGEGEVQDETFKHWYFLGTGLALWMTWQVSTAIGIFLGAQVPASWSLDFTSTLTFIALVVPSLKDRASTVAALTAGIVAVVVYALPFKLGLGVATIVGIVVGLCVENIRQRTNTSFLRSNR